jgi:predicted TIM-barrel fold metal-dependent hydrolase
MMEAHFPPAGACDCHVHVIGPKQRFPLAPNRAYTPKDAVCADLAALLARLRLDRVVLVQPSIYGADNACMLDALAELKEHARAVAVVAPDIPGSQLDDMHRLGVRGLRVNIATGGAASPAHMAAQLAEAARMCARNGWHVQAFLGSAAVEALVASIRQLPVPLVIDHFGLLAPGSEDSGAARALMSLLESGQAWVKLSAVYRISDDPLDPGAGPLARRLAHANPERIVWGSDWPHTPPHNSAHTTDNVEADYRDLDTAGLLDAVRAWFGDTTMQRRVLVDNPARLYGFP